MGIDQPCLILQKEKIVSAQKVTRNNHFLPFIVISTKSHGVVASDVYSISSSPELVCVFQGDFIAYFIKFVQPPNPPEVILGTLQQSKYFKAD